ncbi:MAG: hypothetical protein OXF88_15995 [Rhodobacteraceae bacterium]|nr:hypothetical protein [Paracoccaceae bacterium]
MVALAMSFLPAVAGSEDPEGLPFLCPVSVLQGAYSTLADSDDVLSMLAIEQHVLRICRESQLKLLEIHENNQLLESLFSERIEQIRTPEPVPSAAQPAKTPVTTLASPKQLEPEASIGLVALVRRGDGAQQAVLSVNGSVSTVRSGDVLETGHLVEIAVTGVWVTTSEGERRRVE